VLIVGGIDPDGATLASAQLFDPASGRFTLVSGTMANSRNAHAATLLPSAWVLVTGGFSTTDGDLATTALF
jgi:hypothetical protein